MRRPLIRCPSSAAAAASAMALLPTGIKGLVFAALLAAIVSSLASMCNSISTIFTVDLLPSMVSKDWLDRNLVFSGRLTALVAMAIAMAAAQPLLGNFDQAFQYIQEFTGFFTPGIVAIFLLGMFWGKTTATGALLAAVGSAIPATIIFVGALWSAYRVLRGANPALTATATRNVSSPRMLALGNIFIALGAATLSASGTFTGRLGADTAFAVTLLAGITILFIGFLVASNATSATTSKRSAAPSR